MFFQSFEMEKRKKADDLDDSFVVAVNFYARIKVKLLKSQTTDVCLS